MPRLVVDAGPLIAIFHRQDTQHRYCVDRLQVLIEEQYSLMTTLPVLCEVHKLIQRYTNPILAQKALFELGEVLDILPLDDGENQLPRRKRTGYGRCVTPKPTVWMVS